MISLKTLKTGTSVRIVFSEESPYTHPFGQSVLLRYHAVMALQKSLSTASRALTESSTKDVIKQMKSALSDKALPIQRAAADVCAI